MPPPALLEAADLGWRLHGKWLLDGLSLRLAPGQLLGIIGPNGAGKSSLLRLLAGLRAPSRGELRLQGRPYGEYGRRAFARRLGYLEQNPQVYWPLPAARVVDLGRLPYGGALGVMSAADREAVRQACAATGIEDLLPRPMDSLSQGERMLVFLARLLAGRPEVILADEPVAALDPRHQLLVLDLIRERARDSGAGAILVLHDLALAARYCDSLLLLAGGRAVAGGAPPEVLAPATLRRHYGIEAQCDFSLQPPRLVILGRERGAGPDTGSIP